MFKKFDLSHKDGLYFIDGTTYNCPFCNRKNICYEVHEVHQMEPFSFDYNNERQVFIYLVQCSDLNCLKVSFHLSDFRLQIMDDFMGHKFVFPPKQVKEECVPQSNKSREVYCDILDNKGVPIRKLDDLFFHHQPTSSFTIDETIPKHIRAQLNESEQCRQNGFLTGASACLRKAVYYLLKDQKIPAEKEGKSIKYNDRIDQLKINCSNVDDPSLFENLKYIHSLMSEELHENDWQELDNSTLLFLLEVMKIILTDIYVRPEKIKQSNEVLADFRKKMLEKNKQSQVNIK